jgi:hypothetical protein
MDRMQPVAGLTTTGKTSAFPVVLYTVDKTSAKKNAAFFVK